MQKSLILFLSLVCFQVFAQNNKLNSTIAECENKAFRDTLISRYLENKAHKISYNDPKFQIYCDSVIMICPNVSYAYQQKSMPYMKAGNYQKGMIYLNKAVDVDPEQYTDYRAFMKCIFTKDYKGAITDFMEAEKLNPKRFVMDHSYPFYRGLCYLELKKYDLAENEFLKDIFMQTNGDTSKTAHFNSYLYLGILYYEMKLLDKAVVFLTKSISEYQNLPESNYYLALSIEANNKQRAKELMEIARNSKLSGLKMNEDNEIYTNYPHQISLNDIEKRLLALNR